MYDLETVDSSKLLQSLLHQSRGIVEADAAGAEPDSISSKFPDTHTTGISVVDLQAPERAVAMQQRQAAHKALAVQTFYAETICNGYRADVLRKPAKKAERPWASLMARRIYFPRLWTAFGLTSANDHPYPEFRDRDHGVVHVAPKLVPKETGTPSETPPDLVPSTSQILLTWTGDSLGVPADAQTRSAPVDEYRDLGLDIMFAFTGQPEDRAPVLRWGDDYTFGLRAVMPNGASIGLNEAAGRYADESCRTSRSHICRRATCRRPSCCFPPIPSPDRRHMPALPNELDTRIVLLSGRKEQRLQARRALAPARVSFEDAERSGLLDDQLGRDLPRGAFGAFMRDPKTGSFPAAPAPKLAARRKGKQKRKAPPPLAGSILHPRAEPVDGEFASLFPRTERTQPSRSRSNAAAKRLAVSTRRLRIEPSGPAGSRRSTRPRS